MSGLTSRSIKDNLWSFALLLPILIPLVVFWIYPMVSTFHISFTDWNYISPNLIMWDWKIIKTL